MLNKLKNRKSQEGFTIIEVLIVLAIAGLILLIVFLAVPNLQRSSRNTQVRNGVSTVLGYVSDYTTNHNGAAPVGAFYDPATGNVCMDKAAVSACATSGATGYVGKLQGGLTVAFTIGARGPAEPTAASTINVWIGGTCATSTVTGGAASPRATAAGFVTESGSGVIPQCTDS
jgi:type IV pilus assembly protein PilA